MRFLLCLVALVAFALPSAASAQSAEYRSFVLSDGRTLAGQVLESTGEGMRVETPQGKVLVPYALLASIGVVDEAAVAGAPPLVVAVAPAAGRSREELTVAAKADTWLADAAAIVPSTAVVSAEAWKTALGGKAFELAGCKGDASCAVGLASSVGAQIVLVPSVTANAREVKLTVQAHKFTRTAAEKIEAAGGTIERIGK